MSFGKVDDETQKLQQEAEDEEARRKREQKELSLRQVQSLKRSQGSSGLGNFYNDVIGG